MEYEFALCSLGRCVFGGILADSAYRKMLLVFQIGQRR